MSDYIELPFEKIIAVSQATRPGVAAKNMLFILTKPIVDKKCV